MMIDHSLVTMSTVAKQQKQVEDEKMRKLQRKDAILLSGFSTRFVDDMIDINENEIDSLKSKIDQTMSHFDEKLHILQKKNEINIAENFKDIIFSLSHELDKMTKLVDSLTYGQGLTTQKQLKISIQLVKEYKEEYQKVYDAFLKASRENKQWNLKVHTLRDRVRELEEQVVKQESYLDFFKKKYNINVDNEIAKMQQIEKEKNITLMEDIKVYLHKNESRDEPSAYQKFIKNFIFDKYTFTVLDLFQETDKLIYNLKKQYQFSSGEKTNTHQHRSKLVSQFRDQRAENYYYQIFVKSVNELKNSQPAFDEQMQKEETNAIIQNISQKNTMLNISPEELLKLFLSDNNVQQLIRKHIFYRQSSVNNQSISQNHYSKDQIEQVNQTLHPSTTTSRHKYLSNRKNSFTETIKKIALSSKPDSPMTSKDRSIALVGSGGLLPSPIQTPSLMNKNIRVSSDLGNRDSQKKFILNNHFLKSKTPSNNQNNLSIHTQDESFDQIFNQSGGLNGFGSVPNSSRQQYNQIKQNSSNRDIEIINNYINQLNPRWRHNPTSNERLKQQAQQTNRFFQTQTHIRYSPSKQQVINN